MHSKLFWLSDERLNTRGLPSDPHHLRFAQSRALGRKVSDEFTVPQQRNSLKAGK
jgi:hypothetical protein